MVERPEEEDSVERRVVERKLACVSDLCLERRRFSGLDAGALNVKRYGVKHRDVMADRRKPRGVVARATTNVQNREGTHGQMPLDQFLRSRRFEEASPGQEAIRLAALRFVPRHD